MKIEAARRLKSNRDIPNIPQRLIMLDCEMTGLDPKVDDLIQVAALKLELVGRVYAVVDTFNVFIHTDKQPASDFARQHMTEVYRKANTSNLDYERVGTQFDSWLGDWRGKASPCGDCVPTDVLFMYTKGLVKLAGYDGDTPRPGSFHYEYFEMNSLKLVARAKMGRKFDKDLPTLPGAHDALVDCKNQLTELNAILNVLFN